MLEQVKKPRLVAMDTMNFWIEGEPAALAQVLERVDLLVLNDEEARQLVGRAQPAARGARDPRDGPEDRHHQARRLGRAALFHEHGVFAAPAFPLEDVVDPTGAGDTFAGGFMGYLAQGARRRPAGGPPRHVLRLGHGRVLRRGLSRSTACAALSDGEIEGRYRAFRDLTHFEDVRL